MTNSILESFEELPATAVSDALKGHTTMNYKIKPLTPHKVVGYAYTVKLTKGQNKDFLKALKDADTENVIVVDAESDTRRAIAGDFVLGMAKNLGIRGVVVDGVVRDLEEIKELNFPLFGLGTTCDAGFKTEDGILKRPVTCGGVAVNQGDIIVGDEDGVVVVPKDQAETTLKKAKEKIKKDEERDQLVNKNIEEIHRYIDKITG